MVPHLVRAQSTYKDIRIYSFHHTYTHTHTQEKKKRKKNFISFDSGTHFVFMCIDGSIADGAPEPSSSAWGSNLPCGSGVLPRKAKVQHVDLA